MGSAEHTFLLRVRYSETDQMGTFYNSRALEWFEVGRTEYLRAIGLPYTQFEAQGVMLPLTQAHLEFLGRARYDDELRLSVTACWEGRLRLRFDVKVDQTRDDAPVVRGHTVHALVDPAGKPLRPPAWLLQKFPHRRNPDAASFAPAAPPSPPQTGHHEPVPPGPILEAEVQAPQGTLGIITSGRAAATVARRAARSARILILDPTHSPPLTQIREFVAGLDRCIVLEQGDSRLAEHLLAAGIEVESTSPVHRSGQLSVDRVRRILAQDDSPEL